MCVPLSNPIWFLLMGVSLRNGPGIIMPPSPMAAFPVQMHSYGRCDIGEAGPAPTVPSRSSSVERRKTEVQVVMTVRKTLLRILARTLAHDYPAATPGKATGGAGGAVGVGTGAARGPAGAAGLGEGGTAAGPRLAPALPRVRVEA